MRRRLRLAGERSGPTRGALLKYLPGNAQHIGSREEQQDSFAFSDLADESFVPHGGVLAVVADGMGGIAAGGEASGAAVRAFLEAYLAKTPAEPIARALTRSLDAAGRAVREVCERHDEAAGTTLVAVVLHDGFLHWVSVGDSRAYLVRGGRATQITLDHTYRAELDKGVARGEIDPDAAADDPQRDALTSHLGRSEPAEIDRSLSPLPLEPADLVLAATDGLYRGLEAAELARLADAAAPQTVCERLVASVLSRELPEQDNLTVAAIRWAGAGSSRA